MCDCLGMSSEVGHQILLTAGEALHTETNPVLNAYVLTLICDHSYCHGLNGAQVLLLCTCTYDLI